VVVRVERVGSRFPISIQDLGTNVSATHRPRFARSLDALCAVLTVGAVEESGVLGWLSLARGQYAYAF